MCSGINRRVSDKGVVGGGGLVAHWLHMGVMIVISPGLRGVQGSTDNTVATIRNGRSNSEVIQNGKLSHCVSCVLVTSSWFIVHRSVKS